MTAPLDRLCKQLGYSFKNERLLLEALHHRSAAVLNNERLEFLGDSILNFIIAEELYIRFPNVTEGTLTRLRALLVKGETLAEVAKELNLSDYIRLGPGELKSGGFRRPSIMADALEAVIAAIYLDSDLLQCRTCILVWYAQRLANINLSSIETDAKTELQEFLQSHRLPLPTYKLLSIEGEAHAQIFKIECTLSHRELSTIGEGTSRRKAEQIAAAKVLEVLK